MPYTVRKHGARWAIVNQGNGHIAGYSNTRRNAAISASMRNRAHPTPTPAARGTSRARAR